MSWKHTKAEESFVFQSYENLAKDKGFIKEEQFEKIASSKESNLIPTNDLFQNLLKLSKGLRDHGFIAQADDLEKNIITYKAANNLYSEKSKVLEDMIDEAHPEGSKTIKNLDGKPTFTTVLDKHIALLNLVEKQTKKKSAKEIFNSVKVSLGEDFDEELSQRSLEIKERKNMAFSQIAPTRKLLNSAETEYMNVKPDSYFSPTMMAIESNFGQANSALNKINKDNISVSLIESYLTDLNDIIWDFGLMAQDYSADFSRSKKLIEQAISKANTAKLYIESKIDLPQDTKEKLSTRDNIKVIFEQCKYLISNINQKAEKFVDQKKASIISYTSTKDSELSNLNLVTDDVSSVVLTLSKIKIDLTKLNLNIDAALKSAGK